MRRSCHRSSRPAAKGTPFPSLALIPGDVRGPFLVRTLGREVPVDEIGGSRRRLALVGTIPASLGHVRHEPFLRHDPAGRLLRYAGLEHRLDPAVPAPALGIGERPGHLRPESGVFVNAQPGVVAVGGRSARCRAGMPSSRANTPASTGRSTGSSPCSTGAAGRRRGLFLRASTTSRINAFPRFRFLDPAAQSLRVIIIGCGRPAAGVRGLIALRGVPVFGLQRGHAALAVRPDPAMHRADARAELFGGPLLHAARHQLDCPSPGLQWDDGFGHMAGIPGIHRQPTLQALPGRITQMLHHLGRRHRRGEIQLHRTLSFLKTGHTKIFPFGLQENVRSPLSHCSPFMEA